MLYNNITYSYITLNIHIISIYIELDFRKMCICWCVDPIAFNLENNTVHEQRYIDVNYICSIYRQKYCIVYIFSGISILGNS